MKTKKLLALLAAGALLLAAGCNGNKENGSSDAGDTAVFQYGVDTLYPPMDTVDDEGNPAGFDIEFADKLAEKMGMKAKPVSIDWNGIFLSLENKKYDAIISTISYTEDRNKDYFLSEPYLENPVVLVVKKGSKITGMDNFSGTLAFLTDSTAQEMAEGYESDSIKLRNYDAATAAFDDLKLGRVEGVLVDEVVAKYYTKNDTETFDLVWTHEDKVPVVVCLRKDDTALGEKVNAAIKAMKEDGTLDSLVQKWFGDSK